MPMRFTSVAAMTGCLLLGVGLGWMLHSTPPARRVVQIQAPEPPANIAEVTPVNAAPNPTVAAAIVSPEGVSTGVTTLAQRTAVLAWLKAHGAFIAIPALTGNDDTLSPLFISYFELSPGVVGKLQAGLTHARGQNDAMSSSVATGGLNADGTKLTVTVPPFPTAGGMIHDTLLLAFEHVLGPERFEAFNQVSRDNFEGEMDKFGLNTVTYTMDLKPTATFSGRAIYAISTKSAQSNFDWRTSGGRLDVSQIRKTYPVLGRFIPADLDQPRQP